MSMISAHEREVLRRLDPVEPSSSGHNPSMSRTCQDGTRLQVLADIHNWIQGPHPSTRFMWIYGQAGIGKTTILASVCNQLSERGTPIVTFFCKHDDPVLRDPLRLINSVAYGLASQFPPYGKLVAEAIEINPELYTSHLEARYEGLLRKPLGKLKRVSLPPLHVFFIDAIDECGEDDVRQRLLEYFWELSALAPWLRIIISSRPNDDIDGYFSQHPSASSTIIRYDLQTYPANDDIRVFIQANLTEIANNDGWPTHSIDLLCAKAGGLFLWAAIACRFIRAGTNSLDRLHHVLDKNTHAAFDSLDSLYTSITRRVMRDQDEDSVIAVRQCIGAIITTSMRQSVPVEVLCELSRAYINPHVMRSIIKRLGAVLDSDSQLEGAIRFFHPSFVEFALDKQRSGPFWVDSLQGNIELSVGSILTMERELRFNICKLETSHLLNSEIPDLESKIEENISGQLAYSCMYWISHFIETAEQALVNEAGKIIDGPRLLYWLEVLSLLQQVEIALRGLRGLHQWLLAHQQDPQMAHYVWDAHRFVSAFFDPIVTSAPHIYITALALAPTKSEVSRRLLPLFSNTAIVVEGGDETWPSWLSSIPHPYRINSFCVFRNGSRLVTVCDERSEPVRIFDPRTGELLNTLQSSSASHTSIFVVVSPDSTLIASGSQEGEVLIWAATTSVIIQKFYIPIPDIRSFLSFLAWEFLPDGVTLRILAKTIANLQTQAIIWEARPKELAEYPFLPQRNGVDTIATAALSPTGDQIALGYLGGMLVISPWPEPIALKEFDIGATPDQIVYSADGSTLAIVGLSDPSTVRIQDIGAENAARRVLSGHNGNVLAVAFSTDGARIVTSASDFTVRVWDTKTCNMIGAPLLGRSGHADLVAFSPDGFLVLAGPWDNKILVWDISAGDPVDADSLPTETLAYPNATRHLHHRRLHDKHTNEPHKLEVNLNSSGHTGWV
ncbi:unnamed protein product, partial [Rhizoctonia solani]